MNQRCTFYPAIKKRRLATLYQYIIAIFLNYGLYFLWNRHSNYKLIFVWFIGEGMVFTDAKVVNFIGLFATGYKNVIKFAAKVQTCSNSCKLQGLQQMGVFSIHNS